MTCCDEPDDEDQDGRDDEHRHGGPLHPGRLNSIITIPCMEDQAFSDLHRRKGSDSFGLY